jgi:hypothetical protein
VNTKHVRIDAYLHPVEPPWPKSVVAFESLLSEGLYDDLDTRTLEGLLSSAARSKKLEEGRFNVTLNRVLMSYGLYVTNVALDLPQSALAYGSGYSMVDALDEALAMRSWFLPAVKSLYRPDEDVEASLRDLISSAPSASRQVAV